MIQRFIKPAALCAVFFVLLLSVFAQKVFSGTNRFADAYAEYAHPLTGAGDLAPLIDAAKTRNFVLLGETTHGTHEYYVWRAEISKALIQDHGFAFIAVEGDWPAMLRLNNYVRLKDNSGTSAEEVLRSFDRWPYWMWGNTEFADFAEWLRGFNKNLPPEKRVGIYGMDVYGAWDAMDDVLEFYRTRRPAEEMAAREKDYEGFAAFRDDFYRYIRASADAEAVREITQGVQDAYHATRDLWENAPEGGREDKFYAMVAALSAMQAERSFRNSNAPGQSSWNARAAHMSFAIDRLREFAAETRGVKTRENAIENIRGIVWAHNTHIGDARAGSMWQQHGMDNIGKSLREKHGDNRVFSVGFSAYQGVTLAGQRWGTPHEAMRFPPPRRGSLEDVLAQVDTGTADKLFLFPPADEISDTPLERILEHRGVGVVHRENLRETRPYPPTVPARRYNAVIFLKDTGPLTPLHTPE